MTAGGELWMQTATSLADLITTRQTSALEVCDSVLGRLEEVDAQLRSFVTVTPEVARAKAREVDDALAGGDSLHPYAGVPIGIKDIICTKGVRSTASSKILENYIPPYDATITRRMFGAGLPMVGKTNLDEFAMGSSTENSGFFSSRNPWDTERVPGGSSGGSAAAVASGQAPWAIGTDTGGSIRQPASLCGVVGLKPTYGRVSRYGLIAFASSLDQAGPITRTVKDAAALLSIIAGHDNCDATSVTDEVPEYLATLDQGIEGIRIGVVAELSGEGLQGGVSIRFREAIGILEKLGARIGEISLPTFEYGIDAYYLIAPAEASANLARYDGVRYGLRVEARDSIGMNSKTRAAGFGTEVKRRIMLGTYALSAGYYDQYYGKAQRVRTMIRQDFERAFAEFDLLISPTTPTTAFKLGEKTDDPLTMYLSDVCTVPSPLAGLPAISVPCGLAPEDGLPVGLQFMGKALDEGLIFQAGHAFEQELGFDDKPALWSE